MEGAETLPLYVEPFSRLAPLLILMLTVEHVGMCFAGLLVCGTGLVRWIVLRYGRRGRSASLPRSLGIALKAPNRNQGTRRFDDPKKSCSGITHRRLADSDPQSGMNPPLPARVKALRNRRFRCVAGEEKRCLLGMGDVGSRGGHWRRLRRRRQTVLTAQRIASPK